MPHRNVGPDGAFQHRQNEHSHFLFEGIDYPATRQDLVDFATDGHADPDVLNLVRSLPDHSYGSRDEIWRAWAEAMRRSGGGARNLGEPRDDLGKQAAVSRKAREFVLRDRY